MNVGTMLKVLHRVQKGEEIEVAFNSPYELEHFENFVKRIIYNTVYFSKLKTKRMDYMGKHSLVISNSKAPKGKVKLLFKQGRLQQIYAY